MKTSTERDQADQPPRTAKFPAQFSYLDEMRSFVGQAAADCGLNKKEVYAVQLATDEAFTNIIEHAYGGECQNEIECICKISAGVLTVILRDCGQQFNPATVPDPDLSAPLEEREAGGLGLYFMRQLMDEVEFAFVKDSENQEGGCNILTMVKRKE